MGKTATKDYNLQIINPKLAREWHPTKNGKLKPDEVKPGSHLKVWWVCKKGHKWPAVIYSRTHGNNCPFCSGQKVCKDNCLAVVNPKLAKEWHPTKNGILTPKDVTPGSNKKVWWLCKKGHEWPAIVNNRSKGSGCPDCWGQRRVKK